MWRAGASPPLTGRGASEQASMSGACGFSLPATEELRSEGRKRRLQQLPGNVVGVGRLSEGPEGAPGLGGVRLAPLKLARNWTSAKKGDGAAAPSESEDSAAEQDGLPHLCAYERKRLKNIEENAQFFAALKLHETAANLHRITTGQSRRIARRKPKKVEEETTLRRSMRLQRKEPSGTALPEAPAQPELAVNALRMKPPGPLKMIPTNHKEEDVTWDFLHTWRAASQAQPNRIKQVPTSDYQRYRGDLKKMRLQQGSVAKVVKNRIFSLTFLPSENRTLVAAGDKWGQVGVWDVSQSNVLMFEPHCRPVASLFFSPMNMAHLLSLSYDGSIRCGDVTQAVFDEVYRTQGASLSSFDFLSEDGSTLIVGHWDADVVVVDRRTPGTSHELWGQIASKIVRTVHVHPARRHYILTAGAESVSLYDVRHLKPKDSKPVWSLSDHTKSVASAFFSPATGNRVVTTCADDQLRVYDTSCLSIASLLTTLHHNNNTGRWLTRFQAMWDPKQEDCFVVGSMAHPRRIEVFRESGQLIHAFYDAEYLCSVCSINAMHPTRNLLAGANSSGRVHLFMN